MYFNDPENYLFDGNIGRLRIFLKYHPFTTPKVLGVPNPDRVSFRVVSNVYKVRLKFLHVFEFV